MFGAVLVSVRCGGRLPVCGDVTGQLAAPPPAPSPPGTTAPAAVLPGCRLPARSVLCRVELSGTARVQNQQHRRPAYEGTQTRRVAGRRHRIATLSRLSSYGVTTLSCLRGQRVRGGRSSDESQSQSRTARDSRTSEGQGVRVGRSATGSRGRGRGWHGVSKIFDLMVAEADDRIGTTLFCG